MTTPVCMWVQFAAESAIHAYLERMPMPSRFEASFRLLFRFRSSVRPSLFAKLQLVCLCRRRVTSCRFAKLGQRRLDSAIQVHAACIRTGYLACRQLSLAFNLIFFYSGRRNQANERLHCFLGEGLFYIGNLLYK